MSALFAYRDNTLIWTHRYALTLHVRRGADPDEESRIALTGRWFRKKRDEWTGIVDLKSKKSLREINEYFSPLIDGLDLQNDIILVSGTKVDAGDRTRSILQFYSKTNGKLLAEYDLSAIHRTAHKRYFWSGTRSEILSYSEDESHIYLDHYSIR
jgi:hypothetical protein